MRLVPPKMHPSVIIRHASRQIDFVGVVKL